MYLPLSQPQILPYLSKHPPIAFIYISYSISFIFLKNCLPKIPTCSYLCQLLLLPDKEFLSGDSIYYQMNGPCFSPELNLLFLRYNVSLFLGPRLCFNGIHPSAASQEME